MDDIRKFGTRSLSSVTGEDPDTLEPAVPALVASLDDSHAVISTQAASALRTVPDDVPETVLPHISGTRGGRRRGVGGDDEVL